MDLTALPPGLLPDLRPPPDMPLLPARVVAPAAARGVRSVVALWLLTSGLPGALCCCRPSWSWVSNSCGLLWRCSRDCSRKTGAIEDWHRHQRTSHLHSTQLSRQTCVERFLCASKHLQCLLCLHFICGSEMDACQKPSPCWNIQAKQATPTWRSPSCDT